MFCCIGRGGVDGAEGNVKSILNRVVAGDQRMVKSFAEVPRRFVWRTVEEHKRRAEVQARDTRFGEAR